MPSSHRAEHEEEHVCARKQQLSDSGTSANHTGSDVSMTALPATSQQRQQDFQAERRAQVSARDDGRTSILKATL
jgi:hypothetical protein